MDVQAPKRRASYARPRAWKATRPIPRRSTTSYTAAATTCTSSFVASQWLEAKANGSDDGKGERARHPSFTAILSSQEKEGDGRKDTVCVSWLQSCRSYCDSARSCRLEGRGYGGSNAVISPLIYLFVQLSYIVYLYHMYHNVLYNSTQLWAMRFARARDFTRKIRDCPLHVCPTHAS